MGVDGDLERENLCCPLSNEEFDKEVEDMTLKCYE